jgi:hypothetical protein
LDLVAAFIVWAANLGRLLNVEYSNDIFHLVNAISDASANGRRDASRLMNAAEIVKVEVKRQRVAMVLEFLGERICEPGMALANSIPIMKGWI